MTSTGIVEMAIAKNMGAIAVCDHNSAENVEAVLKAAEGKGLCVVPGLEVTSTEEVHVLGLFGHVDDALLLQQEVYEHLDGENDPDAFGPQAVVDEYGDYTAINEKLLIGATTLSLQTVVDRIKALNGLAVASHIDREGFSIVGQLGFVPEGLPLDALEISPKGDRSETASHYPGYTIVCGSDAHFLEDIGKGFTDFLLEEATFDEIRMAIHGENGREVMS
jgi:PHP family Zn ribbon phosphoesterase